MKPIRLLLASLLPLVLLSGCWQTGDAEYVGVITKLGHTGALWSTWEVELHLVDQKGTMVADSVEMSVDRSALHGEDTSQIVAALKAAQEKGTRVKVTCKRELLVASWRGDQNRLIQRVDLLQ